MEGTDCLAIISISTVKSKQGDLREGVLTNDGESHYGTLRGEVSGKLDLTVKSGHGEKATASYLIVQAGIPVIVQRSELNNEFERLGSLMLCEGRLDAILVSDNLGGRCHGGDEDKRL